MKYKLSLLFVVVFIITACDGKIETPTQSLSIKEIVIGTNIPSVASSFPQKAGGACAFEKPQIEGDYQFVSGWALISKDTLADGLYLGIEANGVEKYTSILNREKRDDVAKHFNNLNLLNSGFSAYLNKKEVSKGSKVTLYQISQGGVYACNVSVSL